MARVPTLLVLGLFLLATLAPAEAGDRKRPAVTAEARLETTETGETISFHGAFAGVEGKKCKATVVLKCAMSEKVLDEQDCPSPGGHFSGRFGPYERPFWPQTYVLVVKATADFSGSSDGEAKMGVALNEAPPVLERIVLVPVRVNTSVDEQRRDQAARFRETMLSLRGLFVDIERQVPSFKGRYAAAPEAVTKEFDAWWKGWRDRHAALAQTFADRPYLEYWGNPFVAEYGALADATERVGKYALRAVVTIGGEEKFEPGDRGKSYDDLDREGKLPSRVLREQFLYALATAFETLELPNPNEALVQAALTEIAEAFLSLRVASRAGGGSAAMGKYRTFRDKARQLGEELGFFFKNRRNVLPGERKLQEQMEFLEGHLARLDEIEQAWVEVKEKRMQMAEVEKKETALAMDLVRGTVVLALPRLQLAYDTTWGTYQSLIESYRGTPGFVGVDPPDPSLVRRTADPALAEADAFLSNAHKFLVEFGEGAPGMPPLMDVVRGAGETLGSIHKLLDMCDDMDQTEDEKARASKANAAEQRAKEIGTSLPKLKASFEEAFAPPK